MPLAKDQKKRGAMKQIINSQNKFNQLRKQAEALLTKTGSSDVLPELEDPLKLIHELQVFQMELELQNEELCRSQQELMSSNMRFAKLYDCAPVGYITVNSKGIILNANLTLSDMLLTQRSSLINQSLSTHIASEDQDIHYHHLRSLYEKGTRQIRELRMKKTDGTVFDAQLESTVISYSNGNPLQHRTVVTDISARKKMEKKQEILQQQLQQAHKMTSMATVAGGIAHDFNNILSIILGNTELILEETREWEPRFSNLEAIKTAASRAADIVKMLLAFSCKTEQDQMLTGVKAVIEETRKLLRSLIPTTIDIQTHLPEKEVTILADPVQLGRVLMNLCTNASQAMEETGGMIEITVQTQFLEQKEFAGYPDLKPGNYVKIEVADNGPGIDSEIMDRIFDPYFTTRNIGDGTGMGLSIVHGIVKNHNGAITVSGEHRKGACFTMLFPIIGKPPDAIVETPYKHIYGTETILFVDDEKDITRVSEETLKRLGYQVEAMTNPKDALALFELNPGYFDVVVTDMTMPHMTGKRLAEKLMEIRSDIPIIISTGHSALIDVKIAGQLGIAAYLEKPVSVTDIASTIRDILDK